MKLTRAEIARSIMTLVVMLLLLTISQQSVEARHIQTIGTTAAVVGVGVGLLVWAFMRDGDDQPDPSTPARPTARAAPWRPVPVIAENVFEEQFGIRASWTKPHPDPRRFSHVDGRRVSRAGG